MHRYHRLGSLPDKRHTVLRKDSGGIHYEELMGNRGFSGPSSLLYHIHRPTEIKGSRLLRAIELEKDPDPTIRMRHLRTEQLPGGGSPVLDRVPLLFNQDVTLWMGKPDQNDSFFYRNAQGDELIYVASGEGILKSQFGELSFASGDYVIIPRGILHQYELTSENCTFFITETRGELHVPHRYRNEYGQLVERSPFSERDFRVPEHLITVDRREEAKVIVKQNECLTEVLLSHHPFDVVGWDGYYYPYAFNIHNFEPIVGRIHEPPPVHQTFEAKHLVVCSFCPRPYDFDERAIPAPYHHSNVMSDEVLFYASEHFMSRKGVEFGSVTLHPDGLCHGPHPGRTEDSIGQKWTDELAVMVDTFYPLHVAKTALSIEDSSYGQSWLEPVLN